MRNDQIFVLLLVILLPLSGCFENTVGDVEAEESNDNEEVAISESSESVFTIFIEQNSPVTITVNGTTLMLLEHWVESGDNNPKTWDQIGWVKYTIECEGGFSFTDYVELSYAYSDVILPTVPNEECDITMDGENSLDRVVIFREIENRAWS